MLGRYILLCFMILMLLKPILFIGFTNCLHMFSLIHFGYSFVGIIILKFHFVDLNLKLKFNIS